MKNIIIALLLSTTFLSAFDSDEYYSTSQESKNIKRTYYKGLEVLQSTLHAMNQNKDKSKQDMLEECNESLFFAIYKGTIIEHTKNPKAKNNFITYCKKLVSKTKYKN